jgi:hypothetical protein
MQPYKQFVREARSNPDQNIKTSSIQQLEKYSNDPDVYISFTEIHKLGINPQSKYDTPLGIYAYPLKIMWNDISQSKRTINVPFAGNNPHIWVFKPKNDILDLYDYDNRDYINDISLLKSKFGLTDQLLVRAESTAKYCENMYASKFWNVTRLMSSNPIKWTNLLINLGYYGFSDKKGMGLIHPSEPVQAVFFNSSYVRVIEYIKNWIPSPAPMSPEEYFNNVNLYGVTFGDAVYNYYNKSIVFPNYIPPLFDEDNKLVFYPRRGSYYFDIEANLNIIVLDKLEQLQTFNKLDLDSRHRISETLAKIVNAPYSGDYVGTDSSSVEYINRIIRANNKTIPIANFSIVYYGESAESRHKVQKVKVTDHGYIEIPNFTDYIDKYAFKNAYIKSAPNSHHPVKFVSIFGKGMSPRISLIAQTIYQELKQIYEL